MNDFLAKIEKKLNTQVDFKIPILRKFFSIEEQNNWFAASDKMNLAPYLSTNLISKKYQSIDSPFGYGEVLQTGYVDTSLLLERYKSYLIKNDLFQEESFDHSLLLEEINGIRYKNIQAKNIVFAEGFGMHANPYFQDLPLDGTKGELLIIRAPQLDLDVILNTSVFILPLGNDLPHSSSFIDIPPTGARLSTTLVLDCIEYLFKFKEKSVAFETRIIK